MSKLKLHNGKKFKPSSRKWLLRRLNDPYSIKAKQEKYRARSAYKLLEINKAFRIISSGKRVVDLGCAPGGWLQAALECMTLGSQQKNVKQGKLVGIDLRDVEPLDGAKIFTGDFLDDHYQKLIVQELEGVCNVVLSDMMNTFVGHKSADHLRNMVLCEAAFEFACSVLSKGGSFVVKVIQGGGEVSLVASMKKIFSSVKYFKPDSSRKESSEVYVVAIGFDPVKAKHFFDSLLGD